MPKSTKFNRLIVAGIAAAAIAPAAAIAQPADNGGATSQNLTAPDQVDRVTGGTPSNGAPQWPANPQPIPNRHVATTNVPSTDGDGVDGGVLIALGGGALLLVAGLGVAGRKRLLVVRQRPLA
jgi:hypothetical protein